MSTKSQCPENDSSKSDTSKSDEHDSPTKIREIIDLVDTHAVTILGSENQSLSINEPLNTDKNKERLDRNECRYFIVLVIVWRHSYSIIIFTFYIFKLCCIMYGQSNNC